MDHLFAQFANAAARAAGSPYAFLACVALVVAWAASGPVFGFSETWQLVINTGTTIITFLMVFLIQNTQNRDSEALQTKLDELIRASNASDDYIGIEKLSDHELEAFHARARETAQRHDRLAEQAGKELEARRAKKPVARKSARPRNQAGARQR